MDNTTISAIATARGSGGIAIVRISGSEAPAILQRLFVPAHGKHPLPPHQLRYGKAVDADGSTLDEVLAVHMPAPKSYTREDVVEIHCHGGDIAAQRVLRRAIDLGATIAAPGEFTKRAYLNGRVDLASAEAVMQLIGAHSEAAARASVRQLEGGVSGFVAKISQKLLEMLSLIEAGTDFPDEIDEFATAETLSKDIADLRAEIARRTDPRAARLLRVGASIVLAGRPNVGKSSLMNALLNQDRAIVTAIPGTTRDVLTERITLGGITAELSDTAGRRDTADPVEKIGVDRAKRAVEQADIVLIVLDASEPLCDEDEQLLRTADERALVCLNKMDLTPVLTRETLSAKTSAEILEISAERGEGIRELEEKLTARLTGNFSEDQLTVERHIDLAREADAALARAEASLQQRMPVDMIAIDLKSALVPLSQITRLDPTEELLTKIFSNFCVGK